MIFQTHARVKRYKTSDKYFAYKMEENSSTSEHVLRLSGYYNCLNEVGVNRLDKIVIETRDNENDSRALHDAKIGEGGNQERASSVDG